MSRTLGAITIPPSVSTRSPAPRPRADRSSCSAARRSPSSAQRGRPPRKPRRPLRPLSRRSPSRRQLISRRMTSPPDEAPGAASPFAGFSRLTRILGQFVAPTTVLTALLFYFGFAHLYWFFYYFGVDSSVLGPSTRDYVMRSVDALWIPLIA